MSLLDSWIKSSVLQGGPKNGTKFMAP